MFWKYFSTTWLGLHGPHLWNISSVIESKVEDSESILINRTNNPVERYNRTMNELLPTPHPTMVAFVSAIRQESQR